MIGPYYADALGSQYFASKVAIKIFIPMLLPSLRAYI